MNLFITDMNNIELSSDSDSNNEVYNINKINNRNDIVNNSRNSDSENRILLLVIVKIIISLLLI